MYEKEFVWDYNQFVTMEYNFTGQALQLVSWKISRGIVELFPDSQTATEVEIMLANWLEKEYSKNAFNYFIDWQECMQEKRWEQ